MNNSLMNFAFEDNLVRVHLDENGNPWFCAKDVCLILEIGNSRDALTNLDEDEKGVGNADTPGGPQEMAFISESGLYALVFRSRKPEARRIRKWVTAEVLPAIRQTGSYILPGREDRDRLSTGNDRTQLRETVHEWSLRSGYEEQVLWSVIRTHFHVGRINMLTLGQLPQVLAFIFGELEDLRRGADAYCLPPNHAPEFNLESSDVFASNPKVKPHELRR
jgi:prophage antirepressor-like protein